MTKYAFFALEFVQILLFLRLNFTFQSFFFSFKTNKTKSHLYTFPIASPSFVEAPTDVEVNEGGSVKLPCRAQGRPKPRIIWDRIGNSAVSQLQHQHQMSSKITQYLEKDTQEDLLAKAKIMSLRSKRSIPQIKPHISPENDEKQKRRRAFEQIMRDENQEIMQKLLRKKRQIDDDAIDSDDDQPDAIPILVFSTQAPQEVSRLQVTDNGELILLDVTERDQVKLIFFFSK